MNELKSLKMPNGESVLELSQRCPQLFVLVRHRGCTFCREALSELSTALPEIKKKNLEVTVVHMGGDESSAKLAEEFNLPEVQFISDSKREYYRVLGARRGSLKEVLGPRVWKRGLIDGALKKFGIGGLEGDGFQLGGVFLVKNGECQHLHDPCDAADVEKWDQLLSRI